MSAAEVVELVRNLSKEEQAEVLAFLQGELKGEKKDFKKIADDVFRKHGKLLEMLSK